MRDIPSMAVELVPRELQLPPIASLHRMGQHWGSSISMVEEHVLQELQLPPTSSLYQLGRHWGSNISMAEEHALQGLRPQHWLLQSVSRHQQRWGSSTINRYQWWNLKPLRGGNFTFHGGGFAFTCSAASRIARPSLGSGTGAAETA